MPTNERLGMIARATTWPTRTGRRELRSRDPRGPLDRARPPGWRAGYVQANLVMLPAEAAAEFAEFCRLNARPCPLVEQTAPGDPEPRQHAPAADLRTDVPRYRVFRHGHPEPTEPTDVATCGATIWSAFCWAARSRSRMRLQQAGLRSAAHRRRAQRADVSHARRCQPAGRFAGNWSSACVLSRPSRSSR